MRVDCPITILRYVYAVVIKFCYHRTTCAHRIIHTLLLDWNDSFHQHDVGLYLTRNQCSYPAFIALKRGLFSSIRHILNKKSLPRIQLLVHLMKHSLHLVSTVCNNMRVALLSGGYCPGLSVQR